MHARRTHARQARQPHNVKTTSYSVDKTLFQRYDFTWYEVIDAPQTLQIPLAPNPKNGLG